MKTLVTIIFMTLASVFSLQAISTALSPFFIRSSSRARRTGSSTRGPTRSSWWCPRRSSATAPFWSAFCWSSSCFYIFFQVLKRKNLKTVRRRILTRTDCNTCCDWRSSSGRSRAAAPPDPTASRRSPKPWICGTGTRCVFCFCRNCAAP